MEEFKIGDTVQLKSGGPVMTIANIGDYTMSGVKKGALCEWFAGAEKKSEVFDLRTLKKFEE